MVDRRHPNVARRAQLGGSSPTFGRRTTLEREISGLYLTAPAEVGRLAARVDRRNAMAATRALGLVLSVNFQKRAVLLVQRMFARFVVLALCAGAAARMWTPNTLPLLAMTATITALVYAAAMFPLMLRDPLGIYVRPRLFPIGARFFRTQRAIDPA